MISFNEIYEELSNLSIDINQIKENNYIHAYLHGAADLDNEFINLFREYNINLQIIDEKSWSSLSSPLIFINCTENELDKINNYLYYKRRNLKYKTIPIVFFSNNFFRMLKNESFSYNPILRSFKTDYGYPPTAFIMNNAEFERTKTLDYMLSLIRKNIELYNIISLVTTCKQRCIDIVNQLSQYKTNTQTVDIILSRNFIAKTIKHKLKIVNKLLEKCSSMEFDFYKEVEQIQNENEKIALKKLNYPSYEIDDNPFANRLKLNYGDLFLEIKNFNKLTYNSSNLDVSNMSKTIQKAYEEKEKIALMGTFSSGKTTFTNRLLNIEHKLKTSAAHNSAVILQIDYCESCDDEYYEIQYKDKIEDLQLISHTAILSNSVEDIALIGVSKDDIVSLLSYIEDSLIVDYSVVVSYIDNSHSCFTGNTAIKILAQLKSKLKQEPNCHYRFSMLMRDDNEKLLDELQDAVNISFNGILKKQNERISLAQGGWNSFCENDKNIFIESPSCYLFADTVKLSVHSPFLQHCSITDTPGFGSISENHDFISTRFLQNYNGILILMLKIDMKATNEIVYKLINKIYKIYVNNHKNLNSIYFLFNVFSNHCGKKDNSILFKNCDALKKKIIEEGFINAKIYAANMLSYNERFGKYFTYDQFISAIEKEIKEEGINKRLKQYSDEWNNFFKKNIESLTKTIQTENDEQDLRESNHEKFLLQYSQLCTLYIKPLEVIEMEINDKFNNILNFIKGSLTTKKQWMENGKQFIEMIGELQQDLWDNNYLYQVYNISIGTINRITEYEIPSNCIEKDESLFYRFIFPAEDIIALFEFLRDESWGAFWYKTNDNITKLEQRINYEKDKSLKGFKINYQIVFYDIVEILNYTKVYISNKIIANSSKEEQLKALAQHKMELNEITNLYEEFEKLNNKIHNYIK